MTFATRSYPPDMGDPDEDDDFEDEEDDEDRDDEDDEDEEEEGWQVLPASRRPSIPSLQDPLPA